MTAPAVKKEAAKTEINPQGLAEYAHIEGRAKSRIDAKLEILEAFKEFQKSLGFANTRARYIFAEKYNAGEVNLSDWIGRTIISVSACTLRNWTEVLADKGVSGLAGKYGCRKGTGIIDTNEAVKNYILGAIYETPHISCKNIMRGLRARFKETRESLPSYRTLQDWVKTRKEDNEQLLTAVKNPDAWRSKYKAAAGNASESITRLNQEWQFDGTPSDLLLEDGKRCNIPRVALEKHKLAQLIGFENYKKLCRKFGGTFIHIPRGAFRRLKKSLIMEADKDVSNRKLCLVLGVTERYVLKVKSELKTDKQQGELFDKS